MRALSAGVAVLLLALTGCSGGGLAGRSPTAASSSPPSSTRSAPVADQETSLRMTAQELRAAVDALSALVPAPTESFMSGDRAVSCKVGGDDDGSQQWLYSRTFRYPGPGAAVIEPAAAELQRRGYSIGQRRSSPKETSFTAVLGGAAITVRVASLAEGPGLAVGFLGYGACVGVDGSVNTRSPS